MRWLMSVSSLLVASSQLSATNMVRTPVGERHRRRADKHLGSAPAPSLYNAAPPPSHDKPVDLHNKEFCVDVSAYQPVQWVELEDEECDTVFVKRCGERKENVCADVVETRCEVIPYTECSMGMVPQPLNRTKLAPKLFVEKTCEQGTKTVPHVKMVPHCKNVTKQNCVTNWETDKYGKQVWAGTEACEPVTWQECKLVPKDVNFIVPEITCKDKQEIWYHEPEPQTDTQMTNTFGCQVKKTTNCVAETRQDCKYIKYQECQEVPVYTCKPAHVHKPTQELLHRKKCLLPDSPPVPQYKPQPSYGSPIPSFEAPVPAKQ